MTTEQLIEKNNKIPDFYGLQCKPIYLGTSGECWNNTIRKHLELVIKQHGSIENYNEFAINQNEKFVKEFDAKKWYCIFGDETTKDEN